MSERMSCEHHITGGCKLRFQPRKTIARDAVRLSRKVISAIFVHIDKKIQEKKNEAYELH